VLVRIIKNHTIKISLINGLKDYVFLYPAEVFMHYIPYSCINLLLSIFGKFSFIARTN
jgi:hypothetical protein